MIFSLQQQERHSNRCSDARPEYLAAVVEAAVGSGLEPHSTSGLLSLGCTPKVTFVGEEDPLYF